MEDRRRRILRAAEALIRRDSTTDFSMTALAEEAGFSLATSYNLIGTKPTILYSLLNSSVEKLMSEAFASTEAALSADALLKQVREAAQFFSNDPILFQPLVQFLEGVPDPVNRPIFMSNALGFWCRLAMAYYRDRGGAGPDDAAETAHLMHLFFLGGLNLWAHAELSGEEFVRSVETAAARTFRLEI